MIDELPYYKKELPYYKKELPYYKKEGFKKPHYKIAWMYRDEKEIQICWHDKNLNMTYYYQRNL